MMGIKFGICWNILEGGAPPRSRFDELSWFSSAVSLEFMVNIFCEWHNRNRGAIVPTRFFARGISGWEWNWVKIGVGFMKHPEMRKHRRIVHQTNGTIWSFSKPGGIFIQTPTPILGNLHMYIFRHVEKETKRDQGNGRRGLDGSWDPRESNCDAVGVYQFLGVFVWCQVPQTKKNVVLSCGLHTVNPDFI